MRTTRSGARPRFLCLALLLALGGGAAMPAVAAGKPAVAAAVHAATGPATGPATATATSGTTSATTSATTAAAQADSSPEGMARRMQACTACHGEEGRASNQGYFPRIAGKPAGYLYQQLLNFREGRRRNATMAYLVDHMSDAYLREIAEYFAALGLPYPPPRPASVPAATLARGEQLVRQGDATRGIPACASCHGPAMTGVAPAMPGLLGLPPDYLLAQFGAWRTGQRRAAAPDCMGEIARRLSAEDVSAMAAWLSSQAVRQGPAPAGSLPARPAMECGSGAR